MNNKAGGYLPSFLTFAVMEALVFIVCFFMLPASLNGKPQVSNEEFKELDKNSEKKCQASWFFKNRRVMFTLIALSMISYFVNFKQAILGPFIQEQKN